MGHLKRPKVYKSTYLYNYPFSNDNGKKSTSAQKCLLEAGGVDSVLQYRRQEYCNARRVFSTPNAVPASPPNNLNSVTDYLKTIVISP